MIREYLALVLLSVFVVVAAIGSLVLSHFVPRRHPTPIKLTPYESGMPPLGGTSERFSVKFYLVAMLFIVFDIETVFLVPWAAIFRQLGLFGYIEMAIFMLVLAVGLLYVWKRGALEWE